MDSKLNLLRFPDRVEGIVSGSLRPPIMADVDVLSGLCNLDCEWCAQRSSRNAAEPVYMKESTMIRLGEFCRDWGVKSWRIAGNSEPTLHPNLDVLLESGHTHSIDMGLITNGTMLEKVTNLKYLTWLGISLDAVNSKTWAKLKHSTPQMFDKVIDNIKRVRQECPKVDITLKLVKWDSENDIGRDDACIVDDVVDNYADAEELPLFAERLGCTYAIRQAMPRSPKYRFDVCRATPLYGTFGADHKFYLCCDKRGYHILTTDYTRQDWSELKILWGSDFHKMLISMINPKECSFCSKERLNTIFEHIVLDGKHTKEFQVNFI